jgi:hydrogenase expression/formation protein HypC
MCLAIPGRVEEIQGGSSPLMGTVDFGGIRKQVCLECTPEVARGQWVIVHVGFAISVMDEEEAFETLRLLREADGTDPTDADGRTLRD